VDYVAVNKWPTAEETLRLIKPHVYVKGSDFKSVDSDPTGKLAGESEIVQEIGARMALTSDVVFSSTDLINRFFPTPAPEKQDPEDTGEAENPLGDGVGLFDNARLKLLPLSEREHDLDLSMIMPCEPVGPVQNETLQTVSKEMIGRKKRGAKMVWMIGAHVLRSGVQRYMIDLMESGYISCIAMNGAGPIHDFELALIGKTTESVSKYIKEGQFGLWRETGEINNIVRESARDNIGLGEGIGRAIEERHFPHRDISITAAAYRLGIPVTVHVGIGYDIVHEHPNCDGAAWGKTSHMDFLRFVELVRLLDGGVVASFGSAVMAPEIFLKALSMARNLAHQKGQKIRDFMTLVCDLATLPADLSEEASKEDPQYYFRPWKTMLVRTLEGGGQGYYVRGYHRETIPTLWTLLKENMEIH
jgi:hypothetical protein